MCGIFGVIAKPNTDVSWEAIQQVMASLAYLSTSRGKEASGAAIMLTGGIEYVKEARDASKLIGSKSYHRIMDYAKSGFSNDNPNAIALMGHSRLVTNGSQSVHHNNQPASSRDIVAIHNGIVTNVDVLWGRNKGMIRETELDTEVLLALFRKHFDKSHKLAGSISSVFNEMEGAASLALFFADLDEIVLVTNTGSLYVVEDPARRMIIFASEKYFLRKIGSKSTIQRLIPNYVIQKQEAFTGRIIRLDTLESRGFKLSSPDPNEKSTVIRSQVRTVTDVTVMKEDELAVTPEVTGRFARPTFKDEFPENTKRIDSLRRCTKCVLPETMPFIEFDDEGVCNYCRAYQPHQLKGVDVLIKEMEPYRSASDDPDCLITFSGGRDSSYCVHYVTHELGFKPITYSYDWGMITDLGRRNQMRMCGTLGLENILVSADLAIKRGNIRKNVEAWLRRPELGTTPLFMAGDKQYFYYANKIGKQTGCKVVILCENPFEATYFKYGFCGIKPNFKGKHIYSLSLANKFKMAAYYTNQYLRNPAYINSSIIDTLGAYGSYYFIPHRYLNFYNYIQWDEKVIDKTLIEEYNWETAPDTKSTWRIGDGTAAFYNYIYYTMAGLTENDTFRSYQIRENMLSREEALEKVRVDNLPRYDSIEWYCNLIGIDFNNAINTINRAKKLYG